MEYFRVQLDFSQIFYCFSRFCWVLPGFTWLYRVLLGFTGLYEVMPRFHDYFLFH